MHAEADLTAIPTPQLEALASAIERRAGARPALRQIAEAMRLELSLRESGAHLGGLTLALTGEDSPEGAGRSRDELMSWLISVRDVCARHEEPALADLFNDIACAVHDDRSLIRRSRRAYTALRDGGAIAAWWEPAEAHA